MAGTLQGFVRYGNVLLDLSWISRIEIAGPTSIVVYLGHDSVPPQYAISGDPALKILRLAKANMAAVNPKFHSIVDSLS